MGATAGLAVAAPLMAVIAVALWFESGRPVLFLQPRLGLRGRPFLIYKFRKFRPDEDPNGLGVTLAGDGRMTRVGTVLERTKLDELPQLLNVLRGEMSLVGARPESMVFADLFAGPYLKLLDFTPGLFGPSQCHAIDEGEHYPPGVDPEQHYRDRLFAAKADVDLAYYPRATWRSDLAWTVRCVGVAVRRSIRS